MKQLCVQYVENAAHHVLYDEDTNTLSELIELKRIIESNHPDWYLSLIDTDDWNWRLEEDELWNEIEDSQNDKLLGC